MQGALVSNLYCVRNGTNRSLSDLLLVARGVATNIPWAPVRGIDAKIVVRLGGFWTDFKRSFILVEPQWVITEMREL